MAHKGNRPRQIGLGLERIGLIPLKFPILTLLVLMVLTGVAAVGILRLKVDDSLSELFRSDTPEFKQYLSLAERFPSSEFDVLVVI